jgi:hypothetical protein
VGILDALPQRDILFVPPLSVEANDPETGWNGYSLATSTDGIHWKEQGCVYRDRRGIGSGYVYKSPTFDRDRKFLMQITRAGNRTFSFAESEDLLHWKELGEQFDFPPRSALVLPAGAMGHDARDQPPWWRMLRILDG